jgi:hypothetical protein
MAMTTPPPSRIDRTITMVVLAVLVAGVFLVLQPFVSAIAWAAILAATTWPLFQLMARRLRSNGLAATLMTVLILTVVVAPFVIVGATLAENADRLSEFVRGIVERGPPDPPAWVNGLPLVGERASTYWASIAHDSAALMAELKRLVDPLRQVRVQRRRRGRRGPAATHVVGADRVLLLPRRRRDHGAGPRRGKPHCAGAWPAHAGSGAGDDACGGLRHSGHRARARAC